MPNHSHYNVTVSTDYAPTQPAKLLTKSQTYQALMSWLKDERSVAIHVIKTDACNCEEK